MLDCALDSQLPVADTESRMLGVGADEVDAVSPSSFAFDLGHGLRCAALTATYIA